MKSGTQENIEELSWTCWLRTFFAGSGALLMMLFVGLHEAQSAVMLPQLRQNDSSVPVTPNEETWIASLGVMMTPLSSFVVGPLIDAFGRKKGLQFFYLNTGIGYGVLFFAREVHHIYIGRFISGMGMGMTVSSYVYLVEICTVRQREVIMSIISAILPGGVLLMNIIGGYLSWRIASLIFGLAAVILFITQCFIPESPPWLFKSGKEDAAIRSLRTLGRSESAIKRELDTMKFLCKDDRAKVEFRTFLRPTIWKPFIIMVTFFFLQSAVGTFDLLFYTVDFVEKLGTTYSPLNATVTISTVRFITCSTIVVVLRRYFGRRFSASFSASLMTLVLVGVGVYEYVQRGVSVGERSFQWFPVGCLLLYMIASVLGLFSLPYLMSGEVYPLRVRGVMTGVTHVFGRCFAFLTIQTYYLRVNLLQIHGLLFVYAVFSSIAILFGIFVLPETRNKTLQEIEQGFLPKNKRKLNTVSGGVPLLRQERWEILQKGTTTPEEDNMREGTK